MTKNMLLRVNTTDYTTIKFDALVNDNEGSRGSKVLNLQVEYNRLSMLLEADMECHIDDMHGYSGRGVIREVKRENGFVIVDCDLRQGYK